MDCKELEQLLSEHVLAELTPEQRAAIAAHVEVCPSCKEAWGLDQDSQALHDAGRPPGPEKDFKDAVLAQLGALEPPPPEERAREKPGQRKRLGGFEILGRLGKGGMGTVLKVRQASMDRLVALKILPRKLARNQEFVRRFIREARSAAQLRHPHIVQAYSVGLVGGYYCFAMEYVNGESLDALLLRDGPLDQDRALRLLKQVCSALVAAHEAGIVHRDIKPSNLMVDAKGDIRVTDFGLAKRTHRDPAITTNGELLGTPAYMPPEVARGEEADARSDLYSLGAAFFHILAGRPPFLGRNPSEVLIKQVNEPPLALAQLAPSVDPRLAAIIDRLLRKSPEERYPSAQALLDTLNALGPLSPGQAGGVADQVATTLTVAGKKPLERPEPPARKRSRLLLALAGCAILLLAVGLGIRALSHRGRERPAAAAHEPALPTLESSEPKLPPTPPSKPGPEPVVEAKAIRPAQATPDVQPGPAETWEVYKEWPFDAAEAARRQKATAEALGVEVEQEVQIARGVKMAFVLIPAGEFMMGSPPTTSPENLARAFGRNTDYSPEFPQHRAQISGPFWMAKTEVTQAQWQAVMGNNPSKPSSQPQNPVESVSWLDCQGFLKKLSALVAQPPAGVAAKAKAPLPQFRLPTEAEWEYACRAGAAAEFHFGDNPQGLGYYAWHPGNAGGSTQPVGKTRANAWGLHDMHGSVCEWSEDWYAPYDKEPQKDPKGPASGQRRVTRGGCWRDPLGGLRTARGLSQTRRKRRTDGSDQTGEKIATNNTNSHDHRTLFLGEAVRRHHGPVRVCSCCSWLFNPQKCRARPGSGRSTRTGRSTPPRRHAGRRPRPKRSVSRSSTRSRSRKG